MHFTPNSPDEKIQPKDDLAIPFAEIHHTFRRQLFQDMLPLWSSLGINHAQGGFCESISAGGIIPKVNRRVRVSARQIYVFAEAARLGFDPSLATICIQHGHHFLQRHSNPDGLIHHNVTPDGGIGDTGHDLYDQAFLLLAYASAYRQTDDRYFHNQAVALLGSIRRCFAHPAGGFADHTQNSLPLRANPHMHLLEAALAWMAVDDALVWRELAEEMVELFDRHLFDPASGVVQEMFDADWRAIGEGGRCRVEPGHNYEWAWLLMRWHEMTDGNIAKPAHQMIRFAETFGFDPNRRVAVNECWSDGAALDRTARLWPQTERLKAWLSIAQSSQDATARCEAEARALDAAQALLTYFPANAPGLWHDVMLEDGTFQTGASPASSLYHITCAFGVLSDYLDMRPAKRDEIEHQLPVTFTFPAAMELSA